MYKIQLSMQSIIQSNGMTASELSARKCHSADSVQSRFQVSAQTANFGDQNYIKNAEIGKS